MFWGFVVVPLIKLPAPCVKPDKSHSTFQAVSVPPAFHTRFAELAKTLEADKLFGSEHEGGGHVEFDEGSV